MNSPKKKYLFSACNNDGYDNYLEIENIKQSTDDRLSKIVIAYRLFNYPIYTN